jgi:hypothetical protein
MELDDLLPVLEAGELLGFVNVQEGDMLLTPLGRAYADASVLGRKEKQLDRAINGGRFAELFGFDDDTDELYLEQRT